MINKIMEQAADVLTKLAPEVAKYFNENSVHREIGGKLLAAWQTGIRESLDFPKVALV
jgi:serine/threonine-protein kinase HipA